MGHNPTHRQVLICAVMKKSRKLRNALLFTVLAGPVLLAQPAGAQQYVPPPDTAVGPAIVPTVLGAVLTEPEVAAPPKAGILSRTGAETMPLLRDGLAALALGAGLMAVARRRRSAVVTA